MPRLVLIVISFAVLPAVAVAENILLQFEGPIETTHIVNDVDFSPDGVTVLTAGSDGTARLWNAETARKLRGFEGHKSSVVTVAFSPDGKTVLTGSEDHTARLWNAETGREIRRFEGHDGVVWSVSFSPDGRSILTGSFDGTARAWDPLTGEEIRRFGRHDSVSCVGFAPGGNIVMIGYSDGVAQFFDAETGKAIRRSAGHNDWVPSIAFGPDGKTVMTASMDGTAKLWNISKGNREHQFDGHNQYTTANFGPHGEAALTLDGDGVARVWDLSSGLMVRSFTLQSWSKNTQFQLVANFIDPSNHRVSRVYSEKIETSNNSLSVFRSTVTIQDLPHDLWPQSSERKAAPRPEALGLIIGNRAYDHAPEVTYAINDAASYRTAFEETLGLDPENIFVLENASSVDMQRWFGTAAAPEGRLHRLARYYDEVFIAYSGHGVPRVRAEGSAEGYLLPVDVPPGEPAFGGYPVGQLVAQLESVPVARAVVFLDACFSGLTPAGSLVPEVSGAFGVAVAPPAQQAKVSILAATAFDAPQYAHWSPQAENGMFTRHVVAGLRGAGDADGDGALSLSELHGYVGRKVLREALRRADREQTPSLRGDGDAVLSRIAETGE